MEKEENAGEIISLYTAFAFHDIDKISATGEKSMRWHSGYSFGFWLSPVKRFVLTGTLGLSNEENGLPQLRIGFLF